MTEEACRDRDATRIDYAGRTVLIVGGTGSFGSTMARHLAKRDVQEVRVFSRDELKQDEMRREIGLDRFRYFIGDVRDPASILEAMTGVDLVFHAAALKQVPSCEFFPMQAVMTNVVGSSNVVNAAIAARVETVVMLSTDKAVYPVNAMGMSKALMEKVAQAAARTADTTKIVGVRYGNVMCSRGSVIPLFVEQAMAGGPITVTNPGMTRFLLSLSSAIDLVEHAFFHGTSGDMFVHKAPACSIGDLAEAVRRIFDASCAITVVGSRHGEKLYETLATAAELSRSEDRGKYLRIRSDDRDLNYAAYFSEGEAHRLDGDDYTSHNTDRLGVEQVVDLLRGLPDVQVHLEEAGA